MYGFMALVSRILKSYKILKTLLSAWRNVPLQNLTVFFEEARKCLPSWNSKYELLGREIIVWIVDSSFKDTKIEKMIFKDAVCEEKCSVAKSCSVDFEEL